jgi:four helix bundle protein
MQHPRNTPRFPHHRLDAYRVALEMAGEADAIAAKLTGRHRRMADQLGRAAIAVPLLVAEGAHRRTAGQKRQRFTEARGECAEVAAACELARSLQLVDDDTARSVEALADRVCAMLTKLIARHRA